MRRRAVPPGRLVAQKSLASAAGMALVRHQLRRLAPDGNRRYAPTPRAPGMWPAGPASLDAPLPVLAEARGLAAPLLRRRLLQTCTVETPMPMCQNCWPPLTASRSGSISAAACARPRRRKRFPAPSGLRPLCSDGWCARVCRSTTACRSWGTADAPVWPGCSTGTANARRNFCCPCNRHTGRLDRKPGTEARRVDSGQRTDQSATRFTVRSGSTPALTSSS
jgi:hypothetical protein